MRSYVDFSQSATQISESLEIHSESQRVAWSLQWPYKPPGRSAQADGIVTPALRYFVPRRFAARNSVSLAHVTGLASSPSAARSMSDFSSAESGSFIDSVLRSSGAFGGRPIFGCFFMKLNIPIKYSPSTIETRTNYGYNKSRQRKTPTQPWRATLGRTRTGFRQIPAW